MIHIMRFFGLFVSTEREVQKIRGEKRSDETDIFHDVRQRCGVIEVKTRQNEGQVSGCLVSTRERRSFKRRKLTE